MDEAMTPPTARHDLVELLGTVSRAMTREPGGGIAGGAGERRARHPGRVRGKAGALVVQGGRVVGVVTIPTWSVAGHRPSTRAGFLRPNHETRDWSVADVMTETAVVASAGEPLVAAVLRMDEARVDRLPVVEPEGRPIGILARG